MGPLNLGDIIVCEGFLHVVASARNYARGATYKMVYNQGGMIAERTTRKLRDLPDGWIVLTDEEKDDIVARIVAEHSHAPEPEDS